MALAVISVDRSNLPTHTDKDFEEWIKYCIGCSGCISIENPLSDVDLEAELRKICR